MNIINRNESNHMNTGIFMWKPSDWGENHISFTIFKIYFARVKHWLGQQPLTIYLRRTKTPLIQFYFLAPTGRGTNP